MVPAVQAVLTRSNPYYSKKNWEWERNKMKILSSECIRKEENALLAALNASLDSNDILRKVKEHYGIELTGTTVLIEDDIVVYNEEIAFKFGYESKVSFSIQLNRSGDYAGLKTGNYVLEDWEEKTDSDENLIKSDDITRREKEATEAIASAIEKNQLSDLIENEFNIKIYGGLEFVMGKFAIHDNQVAYRLFFESQFRFYLLINSNGDFITLANNVGFCETPEEMINENPHDFPDEV